jgi:ribosomal silencing factor RsfS
MQSVEATENKKAEDIISLNMQGISDMTDYFVVCHGMANHKIVCHITNTLHI